MCLRQQEEDLMRTHNNSSAHNNSECSTKCPRMKMYVCVVCVPYSFVSPVTCDVTVGQVVSVMLCRVNILQSDVIPCTSLLFFFLSFFIFFLSSFTCRVFVTIRLSLSEFWSGISNPGVPILRCLAVCSLLRKRCANSLLSSSTPLSLSLLLFSIIPRSSLCFSLIISLFLFSFSFVEKTNKQKIAVHNGLKSEVVSVRVSDETGIQDISFWGSQLIQQITQCRPGEVREEGEERWGYKTKGKEKEHVQMPNNGPCFCCGLHVLVFSFSYFSYFSFEFFFVRCSTFLSLASVASVDFCTPHQPPSSQAVCEFLLLFFLMLLMLLLL